MIKIIHHFRDNLVMLVGIIYTFLTPINGMLMTTTAFVLADTIFAIYVAIKLNGWCGFKSNKLFNIAPKTVFYLLGIILGFAVDTFIVNGQIWGVNLLISKLTCFFFIYIEIKSIDETSMKLGHKSFWVIIKEMILKAKSLKRDLNDIKE